MELHQGTISVYSEGEGHGSTFTLELPLYCSKSSPNKGMSGMDDTSRTKTLTEMTVSNRMLMPWECNTIRASGADTSCRSSVLSSKSIFVQQRMSRLSDIQQITEEPEMKCDGPGTDYDMIASSVRRLYAAATLSNTSSAASPGKENLVIAEEKSRSDVSVRAVSVARKFHASRARIGIESDDEQFDRFNSMEAHCASDEPLKNTVSIELSAYSPVKEEEFIVQSLSEKEPNRTFDRVVRTVRGQSIKGNSNNDIAKQRAREFFRQMSSRQFQVSSMKSSDSSMAPNISSSLHSLPPSELLRTRVLVVDDASLNRKMLCRLLKDRCGVVHEAENGQVAVDMVIAAMTEDRGYHIVVMDYQMPVMDGPTACRRIRSLGYLGIILGVTGNAMPEDIQHFIAHGANKVFPKPFDITQLDTIISGKIDYFLICIRWLLSDIVYFSTCYLFRNRF